MAEGVATSDPHPLIHVLPCVMQLPKPQSRLPEWGGGPLPWL